MVDKDLKKQFAVYNSDTPMPLRQGQGHQTWYALVDPKQGYNNAMFKKPCLNSVCDRDTDNQIRNHFSYLP